MGDFKRLIAWQKAHAFSIAVHAAYQSKRVNVSPGLRSQILRAVNSISDNLAEGCAKRSRLELGRYADMAYASAKEVENDLIKSRDLGILSRVVFEDLVTQGDEVAHLCFALARTPSKRDKSHAPPEPLSSLPPSPNNAGSDVRGLIVCRQTSSPRQTPPATSIPEWGPPFAVRRCGPTIFPVALSNYLPSG
jgi:four helix bundle protein